MDFFSAMEILASGLGAERVRMNLAASNLANAQTTRTPAGGPYQRQDAVFTTESLPDNGQMDASFMEALQKVEVNDIAVDKSPPKSIYDPSHADADAKGYVSMPNVNAIEEMVNMMTASRSYEANITAMRSLLEMAERALGLGR